MYTDIHSHVIWGVDDGAESREETFRMLREAAADNIHRIICTPHMTPGVYLFPDDVFQRHFREAEAYIAENNLPLELFQGAELLYTDLTPRLLREKIIPTLASSRYTLIEFSPTDSKEHIFDALRKVSAAGFIPVIAHMERYPAIGKIEQVKEMKERYCALVQINCRSLLRKQPFFRRSFFEKLFTEGLTDFIATDTHSMPGRGTCMTDAVNTLKAKYGETAAKTLEANTDRFFQTN